MDKTEGLKTSTISSDEFFTNIFRLDLKKWIRVERKVLISSKFIEKGMGVESMTNVNGPVLSMCSASGKRERTHLIDESGNLKYSLELARFSFGSFDTIWKL